jgi:hypothetical protein
VFVFINGNDPNIGMAGKHGGCRASRCSTGKRRLPNVHQTDANKTVMTMTMKDNDEGNKVFANVMVFDPCGSTGG